MNTTKHMTYPAIPLKAGQVQGWKTIPIKEGHLLDPLIPLGPLSQEASGLMTSSMYFGEHSNSPYAKKENVLEGSLLTLFARRSVARRLLAAEQLLPAGHHLLIFDAYRPYEVQKSLHDFYKQQLSEKYPTMDDETLESETQNYVSLPSQDPTRPSPHNTGGSVDLAIVTLDPAHEIELLQIRSHLAGDKLDIAKRIEWEAKLSAIMRGYAEMLNFGTAFDHGGEKSALAYFESKIAADESLSDNDMQACNNRRLLFDVMTQAGFQPYFAEWWHFNAPESQMGAAAAGLDNATFGAATLDESNIAHERMRLKVRREIGESDLTNDWPAEIIAPSEE